MPGLVVLAVAAVAVFAVVTAHDAAELRRAEERQRSEVAS
jgi:hypothetical protein